MIKRKAFTLVELIVVITILAILGTIAFISLQGYSSSARDSIRLSDIGSIKKVLELYSLDKGTYPDPTIDTHSITYSGSEVWTQGNYGEDTLKDTQKISNIPLDPLTKTPYAYSLLNTKKEYEIGAAFEGELSKLKNLKTNANGETILTSYITGNYNGKVAKVETGSTTYVLAVPTIINSRLDLTDYQDIVNNQALAVKGSNTLAGTYTGTIAKLDGTNQKVINENDIVIYEGDLENIDSKTFVENMQKAYSGTTNTKYDIEELLSIDTADTEKVNNYTNNILDNLGKIYSSNKNNIDNTSCKSILETGGNKGSKNYIIDPENTGTGFYVYCDMETDGGGWTRIKFDTGLNKILQNGTPIWSDHIDNSDFSENTITIKKSSNQWGAGFAVPILSDYLTLFDIYGGEKYIKVLNGVNSKFECEPNNNYIYNFWKPTTYSGLENYLIISGGGSEYNCSSQPTGYGLEITGEIFIR